MGFVGDKGALEQFFSLGTSVFHDSVIWPVLFIYLVIRRCCYVVSAVDSFVK